MHSRSGFTLVEILIVIGIVGVLSITIVLIINPAEILRQSRDARRLSDMNSVSKALALFEADQSSAAMGSSSVVYVSIPDSSATCGNLGLPALPAGWSYKCAASSTLQDIDGTGWIPVNLTAMTYPTPISIWPTDPVNTTSSGAFYTYVTGGSYELTATMESVKYSSGGSRDAITTDGGNSIGAYEAGNDLVLTPSSIEEFSRDDSLIGYWTFDEGSGTSAGDASGNGTSGTLTNGPVWASGASCKKGNCIAFDGANDYVLLGSPTILNLTGPVSISAWVYADTLPSDNGSVVSWANSYSSSNYPFHLTVLPTGRIRWNRSSSYVDSNSGAMTTGAWHHLVISDNRSVLKHYLNGQEIKSQAYAPSISLGNGVLAIGSGSNLAQSWDGFIDDVRIYNRALSEGEIRALHAAEQ